MSDELRGHIVGLIEGYCSGDDNRMWDDRAEPFWAKPLVGFCRGDDPVFEQLKEAVGPHHWTPREAYMMAFPEDSASAGDLSVIVWILPQTEANKRDNRGQTRLPAERWARSKHYGESFNAGLRKYVAETLSAEGYPSCVPTRFDQFRTVETEKFGRASTWSERHMGYAAGLGTFGLCDGLITPLGKAMRAGSVVARLRVQPTERPYADHHAYCLYYSHNQCGHCMPRCPVGAITADGHDKVKCARYLDSKTRPFINEEFGFNEQACGLCQTAVPCESAIPQPEN